MLVRGRGFERFKDKGRRQLITKFEVLSVGVGEREGRGRGGERMNGY